MPKKMFPPSLNQGSTGGAVNMLAMLMILTDCGSTVGPQAIKLDGDYTPNGNIAVAVKNFQEDCGLAQSGNFDPETQEAFQSHTGLDLDNLTVEMFTMPTVAADSSQSA